MLRILPALLQKETGVINIHVPFKLQLVSRATFQKYILQFDGVFYW